MPRRSGLLFAGIFCLSACSSGSSASKPARVSTTSGSVSAPSTATDGASDAESVRDLQAQRDDAKRRADDAEKRAEAVEEERATEEYALQTLLERDLLLRGAWSELDRIDGAIQRLRTEMRKASPARRAQIEKVVKDAVTKRNEVDRALRQVHTIPNAEWRHFVFGIASEVEEIENRLQSLETL